ncbi:hypothetical protein Poly51_47340 [Rubripirellula tenax]|uniref:Uncharacterized protein n=1 Tax=Rubripirellula tenax TaxID=2528015 RepID=A0A5C6EJZ6_9BACT|nr:hypothetical protein [Rubripirellula tenax]TWU48830.1 hypothetical protein Poly51_47340 [Rubripirellula tenax]
MKKFVLLPFVLVVFCASIIGCSEPKSGVVADPNEMDQYITPAGVDLSAEQSPSGTK